MSFSPVPDSPHLRLVTLTTSDAAVILEVAATAPTAACPACHRVAHRRHSYYQRRLADLPWCEVPVWLHLRSRRFFCDNRQCARRIFTERLPLVAAPAARRTARLAAWQLRVAVALGGAPVPASLPGVAALPAAGRCCACSGQRRWRRQ